MLVKVATKGDNEVKQIMDMKRKSDENFDSFLKNMTMGKT
jgi:hypothetical protein